MSDELGIKNSAVINLMNDFVSVHTCLTASIKNERCRSTDPQNLKTYQSNMDREKGDLIYRCYVPVEKAEWSTEWPEYKPIEYTASKVLEKPIWADIEDSASIKNWNEIDQVSKIDRRSHNGKIRIENGRPMNPIGRTGITGRGQLGKWGPNHAADPVVTRWLRDSNGKKVIDPQSNLPILQFVSIQRLDTKEWAIPGGMCDPGENVSVTLKREFMEEATDCLGENKSSRENIEKHLDDFFKGGFQLYQGYVDDPRNTDNAWMETTVYNFHDENDEVFGEFKLSAGDDAGQVIWMSIDKNLNLYASHQKFVELVVKHLKAHW